MGKLARPNHIEFVENANGKVIYVSLARVDDGGPGGAASSLISIIDRNVTQRTAKGCGSFFSHGRRRMAYGLIQQTNCSMSRMSRTDTRDFK